ncbi:hypothetical protein IAG44_14310 [Streptomyces roseirectus]|uniref:Uncharacterized protein n=1 Tax=Streptomyces roseirectus TaxID=2768066 RepID=A0A7H0ICI2_9ACTN|nr:hypothetical protein [Streptomyces roseirectus]QNP70498.1 hypothetical protein IAG44_14310 [Streptomyces roseirectus]
MPEHTPFEQDLTAALHRTGDSFPAARTELVEGGARRGRARRLRRRLAVIGGGVAGVAVIGVGGTLLHAGEPARDVGTGTTSTTAPPSPSAVERQDLTSVLNKLLPKGKFTPTTSQGSDMNVTGVFDDGRGRAAISVSLGRTTTRGGGCPDRALNPYDHCSTETLPDGSKVTVFQGHEYPDRREQTKLWYADLTTPAGGSVSVMEWNAPAEKGEKTTRPTPPLSADQLTKLVTAPELREMVDAVPVPTMSHAAPPASTVNVGRTLTSLLPKHLKVVSKGPADDGEFAYVVVDDGKGESYVQINVQPDMSDVKGDLFDAKSETLPDGTLVALRKGPGEKGGSGVVMWTVDTMRTDGFRVVVSAFNAASQQTPATRTAPALGMKDLRAIALSPKWLQASGS